VREYEGLALGRRYRTVQQNVNRWRAKIKNDTATNADFITQQWDKTLKDYERQLASLRTQIDAESL
jgi:16S rRNA G1207 methylase RsmC